MFLSSDKAAALNVEVYPQRRHGQSDFAFHALIEYRATKTELVRVMLRSH